jgi:hypothetical protein
LADDRVAGEKQKKALKSRTIDVYLVDFGELSF